MTKLGKILVLLNLALSLALMIWGVHVFVLRTDLTDQKEGKDGAPRGELADRMEKLTTAARPLPQAETEWREARKSRDALEAKRLDTRRWYASQLALLDKDAKYATAVAAAAKNPEVVVKLPAPVPLKEIVLDANQQPDIDPAPDANFPNAVRIKLRDVTVPGREWNATTKAWDPKNQPLVARNVYDHRLNNRFQGNTKDDGDTVLIGFLAARQNLSNYVKRDLSATTEMLGTKGLHSRLDDEKDKREKILLEQKLLEPVLINTAAESQFSREREKELRARVTELADKLKELEKRATPAGAP